MKEKEEILASWDLPFYSFNDDKKIKEWKKYAGEVVAKLANGNVGLIADTGTGKTIMAFLVAEALGVRTLFVTPTVILTNQHASLYRNVVGDEATILHGKKTKRDWTRGKMVIATPHVFEVDYKKGFIIPELFDLLIVDEMHKARGKYPYIFVANKFLRAFDKHILCLSASPGASQGAIKEIEGTFGIRNWVTADIQKPITRHYLIKANLDHVPELREATAYFKSEYTQVLIKLQNIFDSVNKKVIPSVNRENVFLTQEQNNFLNKEINNLPKPKFYAAKSLFACQYKLAYLFHVLMTEGYSSFIKQIEEGLLKDSSKAAKAILSSRGLNRVYQQIKRLDLYSHPKEKELLKLLEKLNTENKSCLVFVASKKLAIDLSERFNNLGFRSDTLFGKSGKSIKEQLDVIERFRNKDITIIFATSVVEEGLSLPEIGAVIHYNQPMSEISSLQRNGRTGRFFQGEVYFLIGDIPYENALYYATRHKLRKMREIFYDQPKLSSGGAQQTSFSKKEKSKKKKKGLEGQLTISWPEDDFL